MRIIFNYLSFVFTISLMIKLAKGIKNKTQNDTFDTFGYDCENNSSDIKAIKDDSFRQ